MRDDEPFYVRSYLIPCLYHEVDKQIKEMLDWEIISVEKPNMYLL